MSILQQIQSKLNAPKNQYNNFGKYSYRNCEDILEALKPLLESHECSLVISDDVVSVGDRIYIKAECKLLDSGGVKVASNSAFAREATTKKGMDDAQVTGAASSYARKYALNGLFLIDDNKDIDSEDQTKNKEKDRPKANQGQLNAKVEELIKAIQGSSKAMLENHIQAARDWCKANNSYGADRIAASIKKLGEVEQ